MEGRVFEKFFEKSKNFQNSINSQNGSQKCPNVFWTCFGVIFSKNFFAQCSMVGRVYEMSLYKFKKFSKFQKRPKLFPNCPKVFWTCFGVISFEKFFCPVFHGGSSLRNVFKKFPKLQKCPKSFPKVSKIVLNVFWGKFFENFFNQCSMEGRVFDMLLINQKIFKIP